MKTIEQLEFNLGVREFSASADRAIKAPVMMAEAKWWFDQIKKTVDNAPVLVSNACSARPRIIRARYKII